MPFTFPRVPARHYGGRVNIHPIGAPRYADHKAEIEAYGFTITEEKHLAGQTTLLVHGPRSAIFSLMQSPTADEERLERPWVFWPLTEGDELSPATIAAGATRPPGAGLITS